MSRRTPVIATRIGGIPEQVREGVNGFLVEPNDHKILADRILKLYEDRKLASQMGERGWEIAKKEFGLDSMLEKYEDLYDESVKTK